MLTKDFIVSEVRELQEERLAAGEQRAEPSTALSGTVWHGPGVASFYALPIVHLNALHTLTQHGTQKCP